MIGVEPTADSGIGGETARNRRPEPTLDNTTPKLPFIHYPLPDSSKTRSLGARCLPGSELQFASLMPTGFRGIGGYITLGDFLLRVYHITSIASAVAIIESGTFHPASKNPLNNDNGLNCFLYKPGYWMGQIFEGEGARLILEWTGQMVETHPDTSPPLPPDVLHDQHPWRCFIRGGTKTHFVRVIGVRAAKSEVDSFLEPPSWHQLLPTSMRKKFARRAKLDFLHSLRDKYRSCSLYLSVVG